MFVAGNAMLAIAQLVSTLAQLYVFILIGRVICSWVNADPYNPIVRFIYQATDPFLERIQRIVPPIAGLDFSPFIAILIVQILIQGFLANSLADWARRLG
ncbi:MAG: YggT family protein [bacterium]